MASACDAVSSAATPTSATRPGPIAPTVMPSTDTRAWLTRCNTIRMGTTAEAAGPQDIDWGRGDRPGFVPDALSAEPVAAAFAGPFAGAFAGASEGFFVVPSADASAGASAGAPCSSEADSEASSPPLREVTPLADARLSVL